MEATPRRAGLGAPAVQVCTATWLRRDAGSTFDRDLTPQPAGRWPGTSN